MSLTARNVTWRIGRTTIVDDVTLDVAPGTTLGLLGPNGSGKSSLLRLLAGVRRPASGQVLLDGADLRTLRRREIARRIAVVEQHAQTELDLLVSDVVTLGRIPHRSTWSAQSDADRAAVTDALDQVELGAFADRPWHTLSGGERQRVHIARALAQAPQDLLLDEPTNHLDVHHQLDLLSLVRRLPVTSIIALHDLNLAAMFCDQLVVLKEGAVVAAGSPADVLTPDLIASVYRVRSVVTSDGPGGTPAVRFEPGVPR